MQTPTHIGLTMSSAVTDSRVRTITECLNKGFSNSQIASALGVTPSAVTQIIEEHNIVKQPGAIYTSIDDKLNNVEELLVSKLESKLKSINSQLNEVQIGNLLKTVNSCKRRSNPLEVPNGNINQIVQIRLPTYVVKNIIVNSQNELVEIDGKPLISLPANEVEKVFAEPNHEITPLEGI